MQRFFSTSEVATRLGVSTAKVREMIADGTLKGCAKVGGEWQVPFDENKEILKTNFSGLFKNKSVGILGSAFLTLLTIIGIVISLGADFGGAKNQLEQWGILPNFASRKDGEVLIVIATFYRSDGVIDTEPHKKIKKAIEVAADEIGYTHLRVEVDPQILPEGDISKAIELGSNRYDANIVIWGSDTGTEVVVNFLNLKDPFQPLANINISETEKVQLADNPDSYVQFVNRDLPEKMTFLSFFAIGQSYYSEKEYQNAIVSIEKAINSVSESKIEGEYLSKAYFRLGWLYEYLDKKDKAIEFYGKTIELDPNHSEGAYNNRGTILADRGYSTEAIADYSMAIQNQPINPIPYLNRGTVYAEIGEADLAESDFDTAIELDPDSANAYWNRAIFREQDDDSVGAILDYSTVISINPNYAYAYISRGTLYAKTGVLESALSDFNTAIAIDGNNPYFYMKRGAFYAVTGDKNSALEDFKYALQLNPTDKQRKDIEAAIVQINSK